MEHLRVTLMANLTIVKNLGRDHGQTRLFLFER
jgi:hypothetical protein